MNEQRVYICQPRNLSGMWRREEERKSGQASSFFPLCHNKPLMTTGRLDYLSLPEPHYLYRQTDSGHCTLLLLQFVFVLIVATCLTNLPLSPSIYVLICACSGVVVNTSPGQGKTCWFDFSWRKKWPLELHWEKKSLVKTAKWHKWWCLLWWPHLAREQLKVDFIFFLICINN